MSITVIVLTVRSCSVRSGKGVVKINIVSKLGDKLNRIIKNKVSEGILPEPPMIIAVWTPGGSDGCQAALELANYIAAISNEKVALIEFPCLGIPRLAIHVDLYDKEKNTDRLLLDFERSEYTGIYPANYLLQVEEKIEVMTVNPFSAPDLSINLRLNNLQTMTDFPGYLKNNLYLEGYKFLIYILQGQLYHPMTFFGVKESDYVLITVNFPIELGWCLSCFNKLISSYNLPEQKFRLYSSALDAQTISGITGIRHVKTLENLFAGKEE